MRFLAVVVLCITAPIISGEAFAQESVSMGEQLFVEGTNYFRATGNARDPLKGLEKLLASAKAGYDLAPYGLCIALSAEPEVINLTESYGWCRVAARRTNRFASGAESRATEVLGRIAVHQGMEHVIVAKRRAAELEQEFKIEP